MYPHFTNFMSVDDPKSLEKFLPNNSVNFSFDERRIEVQNG